MLNIFLTTVWPVLKKYGVAALAGVLGVIFLWFALNHWQNSLIDQGHQQGVAECTEERNKSNNEAIAAYKGAVDALIVKNRTNQEEFENALNAYANRSPDVVIKRVPVRVQANCPAGNTTSGNPESRSGNTTIGGQVIEAELSPRAVGRIESITNDIQKLQDQCRLVKEAQRINQGD